MNTHHHCCEEMQRATRDKSTQILYVPNTREYGIRILGGDYKLDPDIDKDYTFLIIDFCPWCSKKLPESLRDRLFYELEKLGVDPAEPETVPEKFSDERWISEIVDTSKEEIKKCIKAYGGVIQAYDSNGRHIGTIHPDTGEMIDPPVHGKRIAVWW